MFSDIKKIMWKVMLDSLKVMVSLVGEDMYVEFMYV